MRLFKISLLIFALLTCLALSVVTYQDEQRVALLKTDLVEISKIKYGIFNVDEWKEIVTDIIINKVKEFELDGDNKEKLRERISIFLKSTIQSLEQTYYESRSKSIKGLIQGSVANVTNIFGAMEENIPEITEQVILFIEDERNKDIILNKIDYYADSTFSEMDYTDFDVIIDHYKQKDKYATIQYLKEEINRLDRISYQNALIILMITVSLAIYLLFSYNISALEFTILTLVSLNLLALGLLLPMIDIDARISSMSFTLMGSYIDFKDQVLYFKSKSILQVVQLMLTQKELSMIGVGILVLSFSVLFPLSKLIASIVYLYNKKLRTNSFLNFLVFKTGKWSMADVMVIAIFMAYIGFSGIISEQLNQIEGIARNVDIVTTNKSDLQAGFYLFTAFVVLSLLVSHKLLYRFSKDK